MKSETMGIVTELRSTCETKLPHIKTKKANENKEILNLKSYSRCKADVHLNGNEYKNVSFTVLDDLLTDAILEQYFMARHKNVKIHFGEIPTLHLGALQAIKTSTPVKLFEHLRENTQPVVTKPRRYSQGDTEFISSEVKRLLNDDLIEPSSSPWRASL